MDNTYNGWTNYETWAVNLHMDNDEGSQRYWTEEARACLEANDNDAERAALRLAEVIQAEHEEAQPEISGPFADLLNAALDEVNWFEIAKNLIEE